MIKKLFFYSLGLLTISLSAGCNRHANISFAHDIHPILKQYCVECHLHAGAGFLASGFSIESYETIMKGTKFGPVIVPGDATSSSLYRLISGEVDRSIQMPHNKEPIPAKSIMAIEAWINQGAHNN